MTTGHGTTAGYSIWQIDETVIAQTIVRNAVNANAARRGVNLKEADGSQDIGQIYGFLTAGSGSEAGTSARLLVPGEYRAGLQERIFRHDHFRTRTATLAANSHITVHAFSARGPRMTAVVESGGCGRHAADRVSEIAWPAAACRRRSP